MIKERLFLASSVALAFNNQFSRRISPDTLDIKSVENCYGSTWAFELKSTDTVPALRLRVYLIVSDSFHISPFRLEVDDTSRIGNLGDEVFVAHATINDFVLMNLKLGHYWRVMFVNDYLLAEDGSTLAYESSDAMLLEWG